MKFFIVLLLVIFVLWIISIAWKNRRNTDGDSGTSGPDIAGNDHSSSHCNDSNGSCDGGGDGGGGGD